MLLWAEAYTEQLKSEVSKTELQTKSCESYRSEAKMYKTKQNLYF
jgi:hypothetical protein